MTQNDPRGLRADAPLLDAYLRFQKSGARPFTIPVHKHRTDLVGGVIGGDVPYFGGLDTVKLTGGVLAEAEARAARLWGADYCRFSVGGSTHGNQALAVASPGDQVVVPRTLHRSLLLGLVLAGLKPVWVRPDIDRATGLPLGVDAAAVATAIAENPGVRAVFAGDPAYVGTFTDLGATADVAHSHGVPLIVDAAWAAHSDSTRHRPRTCWPPVRTPWSPAPTRPCRPTRRRRWSWLGPSASTPDAWMPLSRRRTPRALQARSSRASTPRAHCWSGTASSCWAG